MSKAILDLRPGGRVEIGVAGIEWLELQELLGMGGYGSAWRAQVCESDRLVLLKIIQGIKPGSVQAERVRLEAGVSIPSDYIVPALGLREWDASTFLILFQYFPSRSLDTLISDSLHSDARRHIFEQILRGVADAHHSNIVHRDLKPANILVDEALHVRIIDFGISKFKDKDITVEGVRIGSLPWMAPEVLLPPGAQMADARTDIYALGHILYELAMGEHFWDHMGWELKDVISYLSRDPAPEFGIDMRDFRCDFFPEAAHVLPRMVAMDPGLRYHSVSEVMDDLGVGHAARLIPMDVHLRSPILIVESGQTRGARTVLGLADHDTWIFGRSDIAGADVSISRRHLEISRQGDRYLVRDISRNGTMVAGLLLQPNGAAVELTHGDRIKMGDVFLRFVYLQGVAQAHASGAVAS